MGDTPASFALSITPIVATVLAFADRVSVHRYAATSKTFRLAASFVLDDRGGAIVDADVAAGVHVAVLRRLAGVAGARVVLARGQYALEGSGRNDDHLLQVPRSIFGLSADTPTRQWRPGFGPLVLADGVALVGAMAVDDLAGGCEGVVLTGAQRRVVVRTAVWLERLDLGGGVQVEEGGVLDAAECRLGSGTSVQDARFVSFGAFGLCVKTGGAATLRRCTLSGGTGARCEDETTLIECDVKDCRKIGVFACKGADPVELVNSSIENCGEAALRVEAAGTRVVLRGGSASDNVNGVVIMGGAVTIAPPAEWEGAPHARFVAERSIERDYAMRGGALEGAPELRVNERTFHLGPNAA